MKNKIKAWWYRNTNFQKITEIDISLYEGDFELMKRYALDNPTGGDIFIYIGDNKFIYSSNSEGNKYWVHTINNIKNDKRDGRKRNGWFNMQWFIHINKQTLSIQGVSGWPSSFGYEVGWDGDDNLTMYFWLGVQWYVSVERLPKWYMNWFIKRLPRYEYSRGMTIRFHNGGIWWNIWTDPNSGGNKIPKWRDGNFIPIDKLKGRCKNIVEYFGHKTSRVYFKEGEYDVVAIKTRLKNKYKRFGFLFNKEFIRFDAIAGKFVIVNNIDDLDTYKNILIKSDDESIKDINDRDYSVDEIRKINKDTGMIKLETGREIHWTNIYKIIKETPVPIPGKGTTSYNCGEDATYSMSCQANNFNDAFGRFQSSVMETRERYGSGHNWLPEKYRAA